MFFFSSWTTGDSGGVAVFPEPHWPVASPGNVGVGQPSSSPWRSRHSERLSHGPCGILEQLGRLLVDGTATLPRSCPRLCHTHLPLLSICKGLCLSCRDYAENPNWTSWIQVFLLMVCSSSPLCRWSTIYAHIQCGRFSSGAAGRPSGRKITS